VITVADLRLDGDEYENPMDKTQEEIEKAMAKDAAAWKGKIPDPKRTDSE
jgi:hypothetical protein